MPHLNNKLMLTFRQDKTNKILQSGLVTSQNMIKSYKDNNDIKITYIDIIESNIKNCLLRF